MARARYKRVVDALAADIRSGRLAPATRLPTHRQLSRTHKLALATASRAYAELEAMGLVVGEVGRGTFVRDQSLPRSIGLDQRPAATGAIDLSFNEPVAPEQADLLRGALRQLASSGDLSPVLHYSPYGGRPHERAIVARYLRHRHLDLSQNQVLIVSGAQHGLAVTVMSLLKPGDVVAVDALTYPGFRVLAKAMRLELVAVPVTADGTDLEALEQLCRTHPVRAVYTMPTVHNPLSCVMSLSARERLVAIARARDLLIIEDEAYAYLVADAPPPVASMAPERTVFVSSLSKNVATGLRFGFVATSGPLIAPIEQAIRATVWNTAGVLTAIACNWIEDGTVARLETEKRKDAAQRQVIARRALGDLQIVSHPVSYLIWIVLGDDQRADRVSAELARRHISVSPAESFATTTHVPHAIRIALGSVTRQTLKATLSIVSEVVRSDCS
jgi:DNA-binding transcriptional MocR family regulator